MASGHASPHAIVVTKIVFTIIAAILTLGRLYTRTRIVRNAGLDDVFIALSLVSFTFSQTRMCNNLLILSQDCLYGPDCH